MNILKKFFPSQPSTILFFRNFRRFTGGHFKHWHYFNYVMQSKDYFPRILFSEQTIWDDSNPWLAIKDRKVFIVSASELVVPDIYFVAGLDWEALDHYPHQPDETTPIINLIQHVRHANPSNIRYPFLHRKAIRICVSREVTNALQETQQVNGPIYTIPCGLEFHSKDTIARERVYDVVIAALKEPELGKELEARLYNLNRNLTIKLLSRLLPREEYLENIRRARITIFLPNFKEGEGCYLPALEGMFLDTLVICPDCAGIRSYCLPAYNSFRPAYNFDNIVADVKACLDLSLEEQNTMRSNARKTTAIYTLEHERTKFLNILSNVRQIW